MSFYDEHLPVNTEESKKKKKSLSLLYISILLGFPLYLFMTNKINLDFSGQYFHINNIKNYLFILMYIYFLWSFYDGFKYVNKVSYLKKYGTKVRGKCINKKMFPFSKIIIQCDGQIFEKKISQKQRAACNIGEEYDLWYNPADKNDFHVEV